jgi:hypothetical protein
MSWTLGRRGFQRCWARRRSAALATAVRLAGLSTSGVRLPAGPGTEVPTTGRGVMPEPSGGRVVIPGRGRAPERSSSCQNGTLPVFRGTLGGGPPQREAAEAVVSPCVGSPPSPRRRQTRRRRPPRRNATFAGTWGLVPVLRPRRAAGAVLELEARIPAPRCRRSWGWQSSTCSPPVTEVSGAYPSPRCRFPTPPAHVSVRGGLTTCSFREERGRFRLPSLKGITAG